MNQDTEPQERGYRLGRRSLRWYMTATPVGCITWAVVGFLTLIILDRWGGAALSHRHQQEPTGALNEPDTRLLSMKKAVPEFNLTALELGSALAVDTEEEQRAISQKYVGRVMRLTGEVYEVYDAGIILAGPKQYDQPFMNIRCEFINFDDLKSIHAGQTVVLRGRFENVSDNPYEAGILEDCIWDQ